jgi:hypothetical protein
MRFFFLYIVAPEKVRICSREELLNQSCLKKQDRIL